MISPMPPRYAGPRAPTLDTLRTLHELHPQAIAFENLDPLLRRPVRLDAWAIEDKLIRAHRGGYCFEHNMLLLRVLVDLGYYFFWKKRYLAPQAILHNSRKTKLFGALQEYNGPVEERAAAVVSTFVTRKVVIFAIIEAIAVYGLVLAIVGRYLLDQYLLSALSLALLALEYPTERFLEGLVREVEGSLPQTGR